MAEKIRAWWSDDGEWFCIETNDGVGRSTVSLTHEEASELYARAYIDGLYSNPHMVECPSCRNAMQDIPCRLCAGYGVVHESRANNFCPQSA